MESAKLLYISKMQKCNVFKRMFLWVFLQEGENVLFTSLFQLLFLFGSFCGFKKKKYLCNAIRAKWC